MSTIKLTKNRACVPVLTTEGTFIKPIVEPKLMKRGLICQRLPLFERMYAHQTLASSRRFVGFKPFSDLIPKDELDFVLSASFDHGTDSFPTTADIYCQPETKGIETWRRLRNTREATPDRQEAVIKQCGGYQKKDTVIRKGRPQKTIPYRYNFDHTVLIGGVTDRIHPSNVKLMNTSHHSPQTNPGYSRQSWDGNVYQY